MARIRESGELHPSPPRREGHADLDGGTNAADRAERQLLELAPFHRRDGPLADARHGRDIALTEAAAPAHRPNDRPDLEVIHIPHRAQTRLARTYSAIY